MLLNKAELAAIKSGTQTRVFRRWRRPTVKTGGSLKTAVGLLAIDRVAEIERSQISTRDARQAGFDSLAELLAELDAREGRYYRIDLRYAGADPRIALRSSDTLSDDDFTTIKAKLDRLDAASSLGPWTQQVLRVIQRYPHLAAVELARHVNFDKPWLKTNIRKLKNLGLTISHHPGYEISPRGKVVLERLKGKK